MPINKLLQLPKSLKKIEPKEKEILLPQKKRKF